MPARSATRLPQLAASVCRTGWLALSSPIRIECGRAYQSFRAAYNPMSRDRVSGRNTRADIRAKYTIVEIGFWWQMIGVSRPLAAGLRFLQGGSVCRSHQHLQHLSAHCRSFLHLSLGSLTSLRLSLLTLQWQGCVFYLGFGRCITRMSDQLMLLGGPEAGAGHQRSSGGGLCGRRLSHVAAAFLLHPSSKPAFV